MMLSFRFFFPFMNINEGNSFEDDNDKNGRIKCPADKVNGVLIFAYLENGGRPCANA